MGTTTALRNLLRSLCHNTRWKYAVFWKLMHRSRTLLTWEDGYCDYSKPRDSVENMPDEKCFNDRTGIISFGCELDSSNGSSVGCPIALALANMSCLLYSLGEGIVGKVAFTGQHCWVFAEDVSMGQFNSKLMPEYLDEWQLQFAAGIKTILLVPVVPHGVVQLGSLEVVTEDLMFVACIKDLFNTFQNDTGAATPFTSSSGLLNPPSLFTSLLLKDLTASSDINGNLLNQTQSKSSWVIDAEQITKDRMSTTSPYHSPQFIVEDNLQVSQKDLQYLLGIEEGHYMDEVREAVHGSLSVNPAELPYVQNQIMTTEHLETTAGNLSNLFSLEDELDAPIQCNAMNQGLFEKGSSMLNFSEKNLKFRNIQKMKTNSADGFDFRAIEKRMDQQFCNLTSEETDHKILSSFSSFPFDSELHEAVRPVQDELYEYLLYPTIPGEDVCSNSNLIYQTDLTEGISEPSIGESNGWFMEKGNAEDLLDAIVANIYGASDESICNRSQGVRSPCSSSGQLASCQTHGISVGGFMAGHDSDPWSSRKSAFLPSGGEGEAFTSSPSGSSSKCMSVLIKEEQQKRERGIPHAKRDAKSSHVSKRRARTGDIQRARPRDRQMIQDRVKELRELVPNGAKCSIDALLDRTIKHMLFLQGVTKRAEKLGQSAHPKVVRKGDVNSLGTHGNQGGGATWAMELGGEPGVCPIIVENLDHPGHILVEMLCDEHGLFLEIAQIIRHLELTILKGVLESRSDKTWAHFIVEASRGFRRMDILLPLMKLLQRNGKPIPSKF
eukprot:TRINITY_DN3526_c2_g2_i1.p1 TRINITY_DN3526_c2_g2~~TRINITY_DN3526_c2_g2_i1.p1  ORF type:complete len:780 (-),score=123.66 TRINITY_DN3526_c2_g2_i1:1182-3521(-)